MVRQSKTRSAPAFRTKSRRMVAGNPLTMADVCTRMSQRLKWYGLAHWRLEQVVETDDGKLAAILRDRRDRSVIQCLFDPETGAVTWPPDGRQKPR